MFLCNTNEILVDGSTCQLPYQSTTKIHNACAECHHCGFNMCWSYLLEHDETRQLGDGERDGAENEAAEAEEDHV